MSAPRGLDDEEAQEEQRPPPGVLPVCQATPYRARIAAGAGGAGAVAAAAAAAIAPEEDDDDAEPLDGALPPPPPDPIFPPTGSGTPYRRKAQQGAGMVANDDDEEDEPAPAVEAASSPSAAAPPASQSPPSRLSAFFSRLAMPKRSPHSDSPAKSASSSAGSKSVPAGAGGSVQLAPSSASSPASRLYSHVMECICSFASLRELHALLAVSRAWSEAVDRMRPIGASVPRVRSRGPHALPALLSSRLARHVGSLGAHPSTVRVDCDSLTSIAARMGSLDSLYCALRLAPAPGLGPAAQQRRLQSLVFPPRLHTLFLHVESPALSDAINATFDAMSLLPNLSNLGLELPAFDAGISFAPLARLPKLRQCSMHWGADLEPTKLTDAQVEDFRALGQLQILSIGQINAPLFAKLVAQPHRLRWQYMGGQSDTSDETAQLMTHLPSLYRMVSWRIRCESFDFLAQLPNLREMDLTLHDLSWDGRLALLRGARHLGKLLSLMIRHSSYDEFQLTTFLEPMVSLHTLHLEALPMLRSLSFLSHAHLARNLRSLTVQGAKLTPHASLTHLHPLVHLESLSMVSSFDPALTQAIRNRYATPSALMPSLQRSEMQ